MEFPELTDQCQMTDCQRLDFLPVRCKFCTSLFCETHFLPEAHSCDVILVESADKKMSSKQNVTCSIESCSVKDVTEMLCVKCRLHFCLLHRYHQCFQYDPEEMAEAKRKLAIPRQQFETSLRAVSAKIDAGLEKGKMSSKTRATASKVQLMRLKGKAKGEGNIALAERVYFLVHLPLRLKTSSMPVYVSNQWSIGRLIDSISKLGQVPNNNNVATAEKLRIFRKSDGTVLTADLSTKLNEIMSDESLCNGDNLILEYIEGDVSTLSELSKYGTSIETF